MDDEETATTQRNRQPNTRRSAPRRQILKYVGGGASVGVAALLSGCLSGGNGTGETRHPAEYAMPTIPTAYDTYVPRVNEGFDTRQDGSADDDVETATELFSPDVRRSSGLQSIFLVVELFTDPTCGFCQTYFEKHHNAIRNLIINSTGALLIYRNFPIATPNATQPMSAAHTVYEDKGDTAFWEFVQPLYARLAADAPRPEAIREAGSQAGLSDALVERAVANADDDTYAQLAQTDKTRGDAFGVEGTPTLTINGDVVIEGVGEGMAQTLADELETRLTERITSGT